MTNFPLQLEDSSILIVQIEGRDIPLEVVPPLPEELDEFLDVVAEFLWSVRHH